MKAVDQTHERLKMPPSGKMKAEEIAAIREWIARRSVLADGSTRCRLRKSSEYVITPEHRSFWSFQPVKRPAIPEVKSPTANPIDTSSSPSSKRKDCSRAPRADKRTLIRRATFDLTGFPPTPEEVDAFLKDESPDAFAKVVDRLLASPRYGERWGAILAGRRTLCRRQLSLDRR